MKKKERERLGLVEQFGGKCSSCGYSRCRRALQFYHLDNSEKKEYSGSQGGAANAEIVEHPERFQLLCANCHIEIHEAIHEENKRFKICPVCSQPFQVYEWREKEGRGKVCSKPCEVKYRWLIASQPSAIRARMMEYVSIEMSGCWVWTGYVDSVPIMNVPRQDGSHGPRSVRRLSVDLHNGGSDRKRLKPYCGNTLCVNPDHLCPEAGQSKQLSFIEAD